MYTQMKTAQKHYFYKDTNDGNKLKDEDGLGLVITVESGYDDSYARTMETKDRVRYCFGKDGYLRFVRDLDENQIKYVYQTISGKTGDQLCGGFQWSKTGDPV